MAEHTEIVTQKVGGRVDGRRSLARLLFATRFSRYPGRYLEIFRIARSTGWIVYSRISVWRASTTRLTPRMEGASREPGSNPTDRGRGICGDR